MTCIYCGEIYSPQDIKDLKAMGEDFYLGDKGFICPDCLDTINHKTADEQVMELLRKGDLHGAKVL